MLKNLIGQRYGRLVILERYGYCTEPSGQRKPLVRCQCDCGAEKVMRVVWLTSGRVKSCGCFGRERSRKNKISPSCIKAAAAVNRIHGDYQAAEYVTWRSVITRCTNSKTIGWERYGGRGISICDEWRNSYPSFLSHVGRKPSPKHSLDRYPNPDGNYEPGNVRWATPTEQQQNKSHV